MIKCNYLILSEGINLDQITGLASIHNVLEKFSSHEFPLVVTKICLLAFFERKNSDPSQYEIEWKLLNNETLLKEDKVSVNFNDKLKHKWINIFQGVEIKEPGELKLSIYQGGKEINRYSIEAEKTKG